MHTLVTIALAVAAIYSGGLWVLSFVQLTRLGRENVPPEDRAAIELYTFHLGLCFILAAGFLGLIGGR